MVGETNQHTHAPSAISCELTKIRSNIKRKAHTIQETAQKILGTELVNITFTVAVNLPNLSHLRRHIRSQRQDGNIKPIPQRKEDIPVLPQKYQETLTGERFLFFGSGVGDTSRMFIFATDEGIHLLQCCEQWFGDGTFKLCPEIFYQIYTSHALINNEVIPCAFGLLPAKTQLIYERFMTTGMQLGMTRKVYLLILMLLQSTPLGTYCLERKSQDVISGRLNSITVIVSHCDTIQG